VGFEWDAHKARTNLRKHGVDFSDAATVFDDPLAVTVADEDQEESRFVRRRDAIRIISAREATARERKQYEG